MRVYKVAVTGDLFFANENNIEVSETYWKGCDENDEQCTVEGLLIGTFKVLKDCTYNFARP